MPNKLSHFWQELKRRRVIHVIVVYATAAFVILELTDIISEPFGLPIWTLKLVFVLLCAGLVVAVIFSWIYDMTPEGLEKTRPSREIPKEEKSMTPNTWRIATYVSIVIILALIAFNILGVKKGSRRDESLAKSIAVLPFHNLSGDDGQEYICVGLTDEIISYLFKVTTFDEVRPLNSVLPFRDSEMSITEIAQELQVNYIMDGSYKRVGDELKITAQLIEPGSDKHIWLQDYELPYSEVVGIPGEVALEIADHLNIFLMDREKQHIRKLPTKNTEAYDLYLKGTHLSETEEKDNNQEVFDLYSLAIEKDPDFALPYIGLAWEVFASSFDTTPPIETYPKALEYATKALELDSTLAEGYYMLGVINTYYYWNFRKAEQYFQRAISLKPRLAEAHREYAVLLILSDRAKEAISEAIIAERCDPTSSWLKTVKGFSYYFDRQFDRAIELLSKVIVEDPAFDMPHWYLLGALRAKDLCEEAIVMYEETGFDFLSNVYIMANIALMLYECGDRNIAEEFFKLIEERSRVEYVSPTSLYLIYHARGEEDRAYNWFQKAVSQRDYWLLWVNASPIDRDRFPQEPRYEDLLRISGLRNEVD